jgi:hypothetical protein
MMNHPIYTVLFNPPIKNMSREEFFKGREEHIGNKMLEMQWQLMPYQSIIAYPHEDLEKYD